MFMIKAGLVVCLLGLVLVCKAAPGQQPGAPPPPPPPPGQQASSADKPQGPAPPTPPPPPQPSQSSFSFSWSSDDDAGEDNDMMSLEDASDMYDDDDGDDDDDDYYDDDEGEVEEESLEGYLEDLIDEHRQTSRDCKMLKSQVDAAKSSPDADLKAEYDSCTEYLGELDEEIKKVSLQVTAEDGDSGSTNSK